MKTVLLFRKLVLAVAKVGWVKSFVTRFGMKLVARRFVAAETLEDTVSKVRELNRSQFAVTLDYLGESVESLELAEEASKVILHTLDVIHRFKLDSNVSVKLTQLGLLLDQEACFFLMDRIVGRARQYGNFIRIDMEDSSVTDVTLRFCRRLMHRHGSKHVGVAIQSYLYRSGKDMALLAREGANVRLVKGAYSEPKEKAYPDKKDVNRQYIALAEGHMFAGCYTAIATHDRQLIGRLKDFASQNGIPKSRMEFQMLYGIARDLQRELAEEGYRVRIYTPFGKHWYAYFSRRIAERPANLFFVIKGIFGIHRRGK